VLDADDLKSLTAVRVSLRALAVTSPVIHARAAWAFSVTIVEETVENTLVQEVLDHVRLLDPVLLIEGI